ncbi:hypothetical protein HK099_005461 [Clydaea vesicula]|uniref:F-box domain-containing protein n=1 Tax=Clydaea vesicula TaxID=447962 RepID=A0AAD5TZ77_9FUNG|nr:hypothetical protein HK099_005461 [Clydaea vesicula]
MLQSSHTSIEKFIFSASYKLTLYITHIPNTENSTILKLHSMYSKMIDNMLMQYHSFNSAEFNELMKFTISSLRSINVSCGEILEEILIEASSLQLELNNIHESRKCDFINNEHKTFLVSSNLISFFPSEILLLILKNLSKIDLFELSLLNWHWSFVASEMLYKKIRVSFEDPYPLYKLIKCLKFNEGYHTYNNIYPSKRFLCTDLTLFSLLKIGLTNAHKTCVNILIALLPNLIAFSFTSSLDHYNKVGLDSIQLNCLLKNCKNLATVSLDYLDVSDERNHEKLLYLDNVKSLRELHLKQFAGYPLIIKTFLINSSFSSLTKLDLTNPGSDALLSISKTVKNLRAFSLCDYRGNVNEQEVIEVIKNSVNLISIRLEFLSSPRFNFDLVLLGLCDYNQNLTSITLIGARKVTSYGLETFFYNFSKNLKIFNFILFGFDMTEQIMRNILKKFKFKNLNSFELNLASQKYGLEQIKYFDNGSSQLRC